MLGSAAILASSPDAFCVSLAPSLVLRAACATPVIAARAGALPEVVGDAGLLVDPRDPGEITAALQAVERDAGLARRLAEAGPERAAEFQWQRSAADVRTVLLNCC